MSIKKVVKYGETSLRQPSKEVHKVSQKIKVLVEDLLDTMYAQNGVANRKQQIGKSEKVKTDFYKNSVIFDDIYSKTEHGYWQSTIEMFARSFACYVSDKLNNRSDYLCGHADLALGFVINDKDDLELIKAFPEGEERTLINEKIDKFINFLKEKNILHDNKMQEIDVNYDYNFI